MTGLIPVSQWVYDLYKVTYHEKEGAPAGVTAYIASSYEGHLVSDIEQRWPGEWATWYEWEKVEDNVGHPRVVGNLYGRPISESGIAHGERLAREKGLST